MGDKTQVGTPPKAFCVTGRVALTFAACALLARPALAFTYPLSSEQVREAYFLGRDVEKRQSFFSKYIHILTTPDSGPDVHLIEFRTPYEQVALRSQEHWSHYDSLEAQKDYADHPEQVVVRVYICSTLTFSFAQPSPSAPPGEAALWRPEDYVREFKFRVSQAVPIEPKKLTVRRALRSCPGADSSDFAAMEAFLEFYADQFTSGVATVEVIATDTRVFRTTFDLDDLK